VPGMDQGCPIFIVRVTQGNY